MPGSTDQAEELGTQVAAAMVMPLTVEDEPGVLVGRDQELAALLALLHPRPGMTSAGVVVSGMAGVGKSLLARHAARVAVERGWFPGGALAVDMHGDDSEPAAQVAPERVYGLVLRALDPSLPVEDLPVTVEDRVSAYQQLMSRLSRPVLLILDNARDIGQLARLLPAGGVHRVLITCRRAGDELAGARLLEIDALASRFAVELLGTRRPGDPRLGADPAAAAELARLCGQLPWALQTVAVLLADEPARPTADLVREFSEQTSRLLAPPSHQWPGRAALELSVRRLDDTLARLFRLLAVAPGADLATPEVAVLAGQPVAQIREGLDALRRANLLECGRSGRWRMPALLRSCAMELATSHAQDDGPDQAIARLLSHYRDTTHAAARRLAAQCFSFLAAKHSSNEFDSPAHALDWLNSERANLVAAVTRAARTPAYRAHAVDIALGLAQFLDRERYLEDWAATASTAVRAATGLRDHRRATAALNNLGSALAEVGRFEEAITSYHQAAELYRELSDHHGEGKALNNLGSALAEVGRFEEAITSHHQAADLYQSLGDQHGEGRALGNLGLALIQVGRPEEARAALEQASALFVGLRAHDDADRVIELLTTLKA